MTVPHGPDNWRKSSRSQNTTDCVELNGRLDAVRDSKNGDALRLDRFAVAGLLHEVKRDH